MNLRKYLLGAAIAAVMPVSAMAGTPVTFVGAVANVCVLTLSTPGTLALGANGTTLSSDEAGGVNATLTVVASGANPTIQFSAPTGSGPSSSGAAKELAYSSAGGANQAFTNSTSSYTMGRLADTLTVKGRLVNADGFTSGTYGVSSTATCQQ